MDALTADLLLAARRLGEHASSRPTDADGIRGRRAAVDRALRAWADGGCPDSPPDAEGGVAFSCGAARARAERERIRRGRG